MSDRPREVLVFGFDASARTPEGQVLGALERLTTGGAVTVVEVLVLTRDSPAGELSAMHLRPGRGGDGSMVSVATDFRLDPRRRRAITARVLASERHDRALDELAERLDPGAAVIAVVVEHSWLGALLDGVERAGGALLAEEVVRTDVPVELAAEALAATR